jgi:hypothetical protein
MRSFDLILSAAPVIWRGEKIMPALSRPRRHGLCLRAEESSASPGLT